MTVRRPTVSRRIQRSVTALEPGINALPTSAATASLSTSHPADTKADDQRNACGIQIRV